jgi:large subunit ribosomal protein L25
MTSNIKIIKRECVGKNEARRLRYGGFVPGVIYGDSKEPTLVAIDAKELAAECYSSAFLGHIIEATIGEVSERFLPKKVAFHPVTDLPIHVDFQRIAKDSKVKVGIAIEFSNEDKAPGIKRGGVLNVVVHRLECHCSPDAIPEKIVVDLSGTEIGDSILLQNVQLPPGVSVANAEKDSIIATLVGARVETQGGDTSESASEQSSES